MTPAQDLHFSHHLLSAGQFDHLETFGAQYSFLFCFVIFIFFIFFKAPSKRMQTPTRSLDKTEKAIYRCPSECDSSNVILLDADMPLGMALRSKMQARGIIVHFGPDSLDASSSPIIVVNAKNRKAPQVELRMAAAKSCFRKAPVGYALSSKAIPASETVNDSLFGHLTSLGVVIQMDFPSNDDLRGRVSLSNGKFSRE
jgi:hypothetical protein